MSSEGPRPVQVLLGGGIGAGKSSIAGLFVNAGFTLIEADRVGAAVLRPGTAATRTVVQEWPEVASDGVINRQALADIVFSSHAALERLESITHPAIRSEIDDIVASTQGDIVVEVPLTTMVPHGRWVRVAVVADENTRIARAVGRGGDPDDVKRRVGSQIREGPWIDWADVVVNNSGSWPETERVVLAVLEGLVA